MPRFDDYGLFWDDFVEERVLKVKIKREAPEPVWLKDDYLPNLAEARAFVMPHMTDDEIMVAHAARDKLAWDIECYPNYFLLGFMSLTTGKVIKFAFQRGQQLPPSRMAKLLWIVEHFTLVGFNDTHYDLPMLALALHGLSTDELWDGTDLLIMGQGGFEYGGMRPQDVLKRFGVAKRPRVDHIDLIDLTPLGPSLKVCAGRIHAQHMMDLPFQVGKDLSPDQITILNWYWVNDLQNTRGLYEKHKTAIGLREILTSEYGVDVRSKSDPQIAEAVIRTEITRLTGRKWFQRVTIQPGRAFNYIPPSYVAYQSPTLQWVLDFIKSQKFVIGEQGEPLQSPELKEFAFQIGAGSYSMGIGGLHSQEKRTIHVAGDDYEISDNDVTGYYPNLILAQRMYPPNVGPAFLQVFERIVNRRTHAKDSGDKATAETLKIVTNGTFGKTGEKGGFSIVYHPEMMVQVTLTGQLSLLMAIERLELEGIQVISANTDGITVKCRKDQIEQKNAIFKEWEQVTGLRMESANYKSVYSRDVNNYIAIYEQPKSIGKDPSAYRYAKTIGAYRNTTDVYPLKWNPVTDICKEALIEYLATGRPVDESIRACTDVRKFIEMRKVTGGAVKNGEYLGKVVRWYYALGEEGDIVYAKNGNSVPKSMGAKPCMVLPDELPKDIDYEFYTNRALSMLEDFSPKQPKVKKAVA